MVIVVINAVILGDILAVQRLPLLAYCRLSGNLLGCSGTEYRLPGTRNRSPVTHWMPGAFQESRETAGDAGVRPKVRARSGAFTASSRLRECSRAILGPEWFLPGPRRLREGFRKISGRIEPSDEWAPQGVADTVPILLADQRAPS